MLAASRRARPHLVLTYLGLVLVAGYCLFPLAWMVITSFKTLPETFTIPPTWLPSHPTFQNYARIWSIQSFNRYFFNSIVVSFGATVFSVLLASLAGYGFSRFRFRSFRLLMTFTIMTQMMPGILLVIPYFTAASRLGMINTYPTLILAYTSFALPFCIWMMKGFMDQVPVELDHSAMIDGCTRLGALARIVLPVSWPGLVATAIFSFLVAWNEFLFAIVLTTDSRMYLLTVGIASEVGQFRIQWNELMAGAVLATIAPVLFYSFLVRYLVEGLSAGAVKH